jgi:hypothetical protein
MRERMGIDATTVGRLEKPNRDTTAPDRTLTQRGFARITRALFEAPLPDRPR